MWVLVAVLGGPAARGGVTDRPGLQRHRPLGGEAEHPTRKIGAKPAAAHATQFYQKPLRRPLIGLPTPDSRRSLRQADERPPTPPQVTRPRSVSARIPHTITTVY